jgi:isopenicillin N synthase-like dioxygenase
VIIVTEAWEERQTAHRVLQAAVAEADEKPDEHVFALPVMRRASVSNVEFRSAARYLDEQGLIAEGADDYEAFVVTPEGIAQITGQTGEGSQDEDEDSEDEDEGSQDEDEDSEDEDEGAEDEDESSRGEKAGDE